MNGAEGWDRVYSRIDPDTADEDPWLQRWRRIFDAHRGAPVLDLGCGAGHDASLLASWGHRVTAADFSAEALKLTVQRVPQADVRNVDLTRGLPFPDGHLAVVVASLSLHYFPWHQTTMILEDVRRCLVPGGHLLARLNSTNDAHYAAAEKEEIEPHFYLVEGPPKRLFDREDVHALFSPSWTLEHASERTTGRYGQEKTLWEVVATKPQS